MKILSLLSGGLLIMVAFFFTTAPMTSCTKTETIRDTLIVKDTVTLPCNCEEEYDLKAGLVAYYNFNAGTLKDSSGKGNHIIFNNAMKTTDRLGRTDNAYLFDGTSSYMRVANSTSLNPTNEITLAAIVKPTGFYTGQCYGNQILGKVDYGDYQKGVYWLRFSHLSMDCGNGSDIETQLFYGVYGDNTSNLAPGASAGDHRVTKDQWYKIVYTYKDGVNNFYVDGKLVNTVIEAGAFTPSAFDLFIGKCNSAQHPYWFKGGIDEVRIYERALCAEEVKALSKLTN